ncbi:hypothetical protein PI124_g1024 [Phytophthora idaei]|nr:hypothetical protein PI124_g1024 [Phytophthora idaei]
MQLVRREHPDNEVVMLTVSTAETGSLLNYFRRSALNVRPARLNHQKRSPAPLLRESCCKKRAMESLTRIVERYIAAEMPKRFGLIFNG